MNKDLYIFSASPNYLDFEFESDGPNGKIKKLVMFTPQNVNGTTFFSLAFGHPNEETKELDYQGVSNNQDRNKILATVAATVIEFTKKFPDMPIVAQGSTPARTRLYQMAISSNLEEIKGIFEVYGWNVDQWERYRKNNNYDAFLIKRK